MMTFQFAGTMTSTSSTSFRPSRSGKKRRISASKPLLMPASGGSGGIEIDEIESGELLQLHGPQAELAAHRNHRAARCAVRASGCRHGRSTRSDSRSAAGWAPGRGAPGSAGCRDAGRHCGRPAPRHPGRAAGSTLWSKTSRQTKSPGSASSLRWAPTMPGLVEDGLALSGIDLGIVEEAGRQSQRMGRIADLPGDFLFDHGCSLPCAGVGARQDGRSGALRGLIDCVIVSSQMVKPSPALRQATRHIGILLLPSFSHLTLSSLTEPLFVANWLSQASAIAGACYRWRAAASKPAAASGSGSMGRSARPDRFDAVFLLASFEPKRHAAHRACAPGCADRHAMAPSSAASRLAAKCSRRRVARWA